MEERLIKEYLEGKSISQLAKEYPISYRKIQKLLVSNGITIRGGRKKKTLSTEQDVLLLKDYEEGTPIKEIAKKLGIDSETLTNIIKEKGLSRTNNRINKRIKSNYFSKIDSAEKAYWLGFLLTDGTVDEHRGGRIRLQLQAADKEILEKYKEDLGLDCKIIEDNRENNKCLSVEFTDQQIFKDLSKYNIIPNKTYKIKHLPLELIPEEFLVDYLRGLFDGDGCLTYSKDFSTDVSFNFTSYFESTALEFQKAIDNLINKKSSNKAFYTSAWHVAWRGRLQVLSILDILYQNPSSRKLQRKYNKYIQLKNSLD